MKNCTECGGQIFQPWYTPVYDIEKAVLDTIGTPSIKTIEHAVVEWLKIINAQWNTIELPSNFDAFVNLTGLRFIYCWVEISRPIAEKLLRNIRIEKNRESNTSLY